MKQKKMTKILFILCAMFMLSACNSKIEITEINQPRTETCARSFDAWKVSGIYAEYIIEKTVEQDKNAALQLVEKIEEQEREILEYIDWKVDNPISVWIVNTDIVGTGNITDSYVLDKKIITGKEQIENGEYFATYVKKATGIQNSWIAYGITGTVTEKEATKDSGKELARYYENTEDMRILGLADTRFLSGICSEEEIQIAKKTAISFYTYWKEQQGTDDIKKLGESLKGKNLTEEKNNWLTSIGVKKEYAYPYEGLYDITVGISKKYSKGISASGTYANYEIKLQDDSAYFMSSVENVERFLYENQKGAKELHDYLGKAENSNLLHLDRKASYIIEEKNNSYQELGGYTDISTGEITIDSPYVLYCHLHELTHLWSQAKQQDSTMDKIWFGEGFACYGALQVKEYCGIDIGSFKDADFLWCQAKMLESAGIKEAKDILELYGQLGGSMEEDKFDHILFNNVYVYSNVEKYGLEEAVQRYGYPYYESFITYLIENYSLEDVIEVVTNHHTLEEIFEKNFEELQQEWLRNLIQ